VTAPLLTDEARQWVGTETDIECVPLSRSELQRFLVGIGMAPTRLPDEEVIVPPMIYQTLCRLPVEISTLTKDGMPQDRRPPVGEGRGMNGQVTLDFKRPLRIGDVLRGKRRLVSLEPKEGRRRSMVVATWWTEFRDADDHVVLVETVQQLLF